MIGALSPSRVDRRQRGASRGNQLKERSMGEDTITENAAEPSAARRRFRLPVLIVALIAVFLTTRGLNVVATHVPIIAVVVGSGTAVAALFCYHAGVVSENNVEINMTGGGPCRDASAGGPGLGLVAGAWVWTGRSLGPG